MITDSKGQRLIGHLQQICVNNSTTAVHQSRAFAVISITRSILAATEPSFCFFASANAELDRRKCVIAEMEAEMAGRPPNPDTQSNIERTAYLRGTFNMETGEVVAALGGASAGITPNKVQRWIRDAIEQRLLVEKVVTKFNRNAVDGDRLDELKKIRRWHELLTVLQKVPSQTRVTVRSVHVFDSGTSKDVVERMERFSQRAVGALLSVLDRSRVCALTWGYTLMDLVDALETSGLDLPTHPIEFVPVCAEQIGSTKHRTSASVHAERLHELVNQRALTSNPPVSLHGVPPFTPSWFRGKTDFLRYIDSFDSYVKVFGPSFTSSKKRPPDPARSSAERGPAIARADALLTGIGSRSGLLGGFRNLLMQHAQISAEELSRIVIGDVGGVLIPSPTYKPKKGARVSELSEIWNGLKREHLEEIVKRAHAQETPGVVIASVLDEEENGRAQTLCEVLKLGLANELIIDERLAVQLEQELKKPEI